MLHMNYSEYQLKGETLDVYQPWYADDAGAGGNFSSICHYFEQLQELGPSWSYFLEPTKSILVLQGHNNERVESYFRDSKSKVTTGSWYLIGGFIGEGSVQQAWIGAGGKTRVHVAKRYPQSVVSKTSFYIYPYYRNLFCRNANSCSASPRDLDWSSVLAITSMLSQNFLPALFGIDSVSVTKIQLLACLPIWQSKSPPKLLTTTGPDQQ
jgi:hypothetical protein